MKRFITYLLLLLAFNSHAWNSYGHELIAQIAYDNLTPQSKKIYETYIKHLEPLSPELTFVKSASWLDQIRAKDVHWFDQLHYVDIPFSTNEQLELPAKAKINALWGISQALTILSSPKSANADKALSLAILIHIVGDIHQPLHTANKISKTLPKGDKGGNLFYLAPNSIGNNLHQYWDNGGGYLKKSRKEFMLVTMHPLTKESCSLINIKGKPKDWVKETHQIALTEAYSVLTHNKPSKKYQQKVKSITEKQLVIAGCRLAALLNELVDNRVDS